VSGQDDRQTDAAALVQRAYALSSAEESKALYRDWATSYDQSMLDGLGYLTPTLTAELLTRHLDARDAAILDIGSGTGLAGVALQAAGFTQLDALDFSREMLEVAASRNVYQRLIQADLSAPLSMLGDHHYAAMICTGTFTHAHVGASCMSELWRILAPGGFLACTVHHDVWISSGFRDTVAHMESLGVLRTLHQKPGRYYATSEHDEGDYIVWQRLGNASAD